MVIIFPTLEPSLFSLALPWNVLHVWTGRHGEKLKGESGKQPVFPLFVTTVFIIFPLVKFDPTVASCVLFGESS